MIDSTLFRRGLKNSVHTLTMLFGLTSCVAKAQESEISFQLQDNLIRVPLMINGTKVDAVLDSGTGAFGLDRAFALTLGLHPGTESGQVPGGGAAIPMFPVQIAHVQFGPEHLSQVAGIALSMANLSSSAGFPVQALLGQPVFQVQPISIDYPNRKIMFLPAGQKVDCANPLPFVIKGGAPVVTVELEATKMSEPRLLHLIVDLGTRHYAVMLGGPYLEAAQGKQLEQSGKATQVGTGTGGAIAGTVVTVAKLTVGSQSFSALPVALTQHVGAFSAEIADGTLGVPLWAAGIISFDYIHHEICLDLPITASHGASAGN